MIDDLEAAISTLRGVDPDPLDAAELSELVERSTALANELDAARLRLVDAWDARRAWSHDGAQTGAAWLAHRCHMPKQAARADVRLARQLRDLPAAAEAFAAGHICRDHVRRLARSRSERTQEALERDEAVLVEQAERLSFTDFAKTVAYWEQLADPDGAELDARARFDTRGAFVSSTLDGMRVLDARFDPVAGSAVETAIAREEQALFEADWAEARARVGDTVTVDDLARTGPQRRADATANLITRGATSTSAGARPLVNVLVDYPTLVGRVCELADGTVITPGQLAPLLTEADVQRVVFAGRERVVSIASPNRFFEGHLRHAIELRDRTCTHPTCDTPAERCEVDHVVPWPAGPTSEANGALLCRFHHRLKTRGDPTGSAAVQSPP